MRIGEVTGTPAHFVVVVGFNDEIIVPMASGSMGQYTYVPRDEFVHRWHDIDGLDRVNQSGLVIHKGPPQYDQAAITKLD